MNQIHLGKQTVSDLELTQLIWCEKTSKLQAVCGGKRSTVKFSSPKEAKDAFYAAARACSATHSCSQRPMTKKESIASPLLLIGAGILLLAAFHLASLLFPCPLTEKLISSSAALSLAGGIWILGGLWCAARLLMPAELHILHRD